MTLKPFASALLQFALLALGAFVLIPATSYADPVTWLQFGVLVAGAVASVWVPLADIAWRAAFKTGVVVVGGALSAAIPFVVDGRFPVESIPLLALAVLQVLATETGVQIRTFKSGVIQGGQTVINGPITVDGNFTDQSAAAVASAKLDFGKRLS